MTKALYRERWGSKGSGVRTRQEDSPAVELGVRVRKKADQERRG